ncbi:MAG: leucine-rich repeat domain-containing protein [Pseudomonadota bacterium]|nr:leucine-rich repeat domain-containing protein [Pseudomonadota bacterium]MEC8978149.1 leucine-rich repeat domain-containing protein [Pseudomonadota bacterium]
MRLYLTRYAKIRDLSPLASCTALTDLNLHECSLITDLSPLANHPTLSELIGPDGDDLTSLSDTQQPGP